jgi:hypothetical protein
MKLTPHHVAQILDITDVACLLSGLDPAAVDAGAYHHTDLVHIPGWKKGMVKAILAGDLVAEEGACLISTEEGTLLFLNDDMSLDSYDPHRDEIFAQFRRKDLYHWLTSIGTADEDIPKALRIMPKAQTEEAPQEKPVHHRSRQTYLKLIEGLALEAMGEIPAEPFKAAGILQIILDGHGLALDDETIANVIKDIQVVRDKRPKNPSDAT